MEHFSESALSAINKAKQIAKSLSCGYIADEHILLGLFNEDCTVRTVLLGYSVTDEELLDKAKQFSTTTNEPIVDIDFTPASKRVLDESSFEAHEANSNLVYPEHVFLALLRDRDGAAARILDSLGISLNELEELVTSSGEDASSNQDSGKPVTTPVLDKYSENITDKAKRGELDPVIGRNIEIRRISQIICRRTKNNPVLVGEPGVGKTAIIEGLAVRIEEGEVPEFLLGKRILSLDLTGMVAGTKFRGEFEERFKTVIDELKKSTNTILFIDELHTIVGAGNSEGSNDAANILKPALARGKIQVIGATTLDEYRRYIERDASLERRFQPVMVEEPSVEDTKLILFGLRKRFEEHHGVTICDDAIEAACVMSDRYIQGRFLPDKAIDLIDEAASMVRINEAQSKPDLSSREIELERLIREKEQLIAVADYTAANEIKEREKALAEEIAKLKRDWEERRVNSSGCVTADKISEVVFEWTGIPVTKMTESESEKYLKLESILHKRVIGQEAAISAICAALRRQRAGLGEEQQPVGSFLFVGPTGVGKTELSKALAQALFDDEEALIRLDMSEYSEQSSVAKLIGSPPGYIGYEDAGQLTERVRRRGYSVILLDEIEKAHSDVFNILLQILDDGRLTDAKGKTVSFKNAIIIMTSNVGTYEKRQQKIGFDTGSLSSEVSTQAERERIIEGLKRTFRPEFLNRIDEIIIFHKLNSEHIKSIAELMLNSCISRIERLGITVQLEDNVIDYIASIGFDPVYGARPLKRAVTHTLEDAFSEKLLSWEIKSGDKVKIYIENDTPSIEVL